MYVNGVKVVRKTGRYKKKFYEKLHSPILTHSCSTFSLHLITIRIRGVTYVKYEHER